MLTFTLDNSTGKTPARALIGLLRMAFRRHYSVGCFIVRDIIATRSERTRTGAFEVELYTDGSGLEVAFLGCWLVFGVEAKWGTMALSRT